MPFIYFLRIKSTPPPSFDPVIYGQTDAGQKVIRKAHLSSCELKKKTNMIYWCKQAEKYVLVNVLLVGAYFAVSVHSNKLNFY